jgi:hypothetical protein
LVSRSCGCSELAATSRVLNRMPGSLRRQRRVREWQQRPARGDPPIARRRLVGVVAPGLSAYKPFNGAACVSSASPSTLHCAAALADRRLLVRGHHAHAHAGTPTCRHMHKTQASRCTSALGLQLGRRIWPLDVALDVRPSLPDGGPLPMDVHHIRVPCAAGAFAARPIISFWERRWVWRWTWPLAAGLVTPPSASSAAHIRVQS